MQWAFAEFCCGATEIDAILRRPRRKCLNRPYWSTFCWVESDEAEGFQVVTKSTLKGCTRLPSLGLYVAFLPPKSNRDRTWNQIVNQVVMWHFQNWGKPDLVSLLKFSLIPWILSPAQSEEQLCFFRGKTSNRMKPSFSHNVLLSVPQAMEKFLSFLNV